MEYTDSFLIKEGYGYMIEMAKAIARKTGYSTTVNYFDQYQGAYMCVGYMRDGKYIPDGGTCSCNVKVWNGEYLVRMHADGKHTPRPSFYVEFPERMGINVLKGLGLKKEYYGVKCHSSKEIVFVLKVILNFITAKTKTAKKEEFRKLRSLELIEWD